MALAGLNRPIGLTITKIARKIAQTTIALRNVRNSQSFVLKSLIYAFNPSQNAPLKI